MDLLITGGTGALGQALVEHLIQRNLYKRICIYSRDEHKQELMKERFNYDANSPLRFFIGDVRDADRLRFSMRGITHVVHAAALKVVPASEYNPIEYINTNILGAQNVIQAVWDNDPSGWCKVLAISTDKAVHPVNLYGATKLAAEKLFVAANNVRGAISSKFSVLRYGNVANSTGSVLPVFLRQLAKREQLTLTHPDMTRFWITLNDAVIDIINSLGYMGGGEVFIPKMYSFSVQELAHYLMKMYNYKEEDNWCVIIGKRPGEKIHEYIMTDLEAETYVYHKLIDMYILNYRGSGEHVYKPSTAIGVSSNHGATPRIVDFKPNLEEIGLWPEHLKS